MSTPHGSVLVCMVFHCATKVNNCLNIVQTGGQPAGNPMSVKVHFNVSKCAACTLVEIKCHIITTAKAIKFSAMLSFHGATRKKKIMLVNFSFWQTCFVEYMFK